MLALSAQIPVQQDRMLAGLRLSDASSILWWFSKFWGPSSFMLLSSGLSKLPVQEAPWPREPHVAQWCLGAFFGATPQ